jgi:hypothetical protein
VARKRVNILISAQDKASKVFRRVAKAAAATAAGITTAGVAAAAGAAVGLGRMTAAGLESIDALAKFADRIGASTEGLAGLHHAAQINGVAVEQLNMGLQRMTRRVAEAANGTGEAQGALAELGIDAKQLAQLQPDEQFRAIADAMLEVEGQSDRVRLAFKLFDSEGVSLVNLLRLGADGIADLQAEADLLGLTFSRLDAAKVEAANDAMLRARQLLVGIGRVLAIEIAPYLEAGVSAFVQWANEGEGAGARIVHALESVAEGALRVMQILDEPRRRILYARRAVLDSQLLAAREARNLAQRLGGDRLEIRQAERDTIDPLLEKIKGVDRELRTLDPERREKSLREFFEGIRIDATERAAKALAGPNPGEGPRGSGEFDYLRQPKRAPGAPGRVVSPNNPAAVESRFLQGFGLVRAGASESARQRQILAEQAATQQQMLALLDNVWALLSGSPPILVGQTVQRGGG